MNAFPNTKVTGPRLVRRMVVAAAATAAATGLVMGATAGETLGAGATAPARAAVPTAAAVGSTPPNDFSAIVKNNLLTGSVDDCWVDIGWVVDTIAYPNYRHVAGVRVNCRSVHSVIDATVAM